MWVEHPNGHLSERLVNMEKGVTNQANAFEMKSTRAIVKDSVLHAELKTSKLTPVNDGHSVKLGMVTKRGNFLQLMELDGLAMNRDDALLVVNGGKVVAIGQGHFDDTEGKKWKLECAGCGTRRRREDQVRDAARGSPGRALFGEGEEGIAWKIHLDTFGGGKGGGRVCGAGAGLWWRRRVG